MFLKGNDCTHTHTHTHTHYSQESKVKLLERSKASLWVRNSELNVSFLLYQYRQAKSKIESAEVSEITSGLYTGFLPRGGELGVCQKEGGGGEAVRSCKAATGGWVQEWDVPPPAQLDIILS